MNKKFYHYLIFTGLISVAILLIYAFYNKKTQIINLNLYKSNTVTQIRTSDNKIYPTNNDLLKTTNSPIYKIALFADSHENYEGINKVYNELESINPSLAFAVGDNTNFGDVASLKRFSTEVSKFKGIIVIPGDHDIAQSGDLTNFDKVFNTPSIVTLSNPPLNIFIFKNQFNFTPFEDVVFENIISKIENSDIIIMAQPIYMPNNDIFYNKKMGTFDGDETLLQDIKKSNLKKYNNQALRFLEVLRKTKKPLLVIAGDHHRSLTFSDPININITYHNLGAISEFVTLGNLQVKQKALQSKRFTVIDVFYNNSSVVDYKIIEKIID